MPRPINVLPGQKPNMVLGEELQHGFGGYNLVCICWDEDHSRWLCYEVGEKTCTATEAPSAN